MTWAQTYAQGWYDRIGHGYDGHMAGKTITVDRDAFELLNGRRKRGQSFSQVIKDSLGAPGTVGAFLTAARKIRISEETLDEMDSVVAERRRSRVRAPTI